MLAIIILVLVTLLVGNTFLSKKKTVSKKKKIVTIIISCVLIILVIYPLLYDGIKNTYCLSDDKCVTVWKRGNGDVYVIAGKHQGYKEPNVSYIKTSNKQFFTLYFSTDFPYKIIVKDEGNLESNRKMYQIKNNKNDKWQFLEYSEMYKKNLYKPGATKFNDVKNNINYMVINIHENYATDKTGEKIE